MKPDEVIGGVTYRLLYSEQERINWSPLVAALVSRASHRGKNVVVIPLPSPASSLRPDWREKSAITISEKPTTYNLIT
ncbi:MAG: hypothetical protein EOM20_15620 [Spartobacteria bacterium]|nr:hypothetical protein [Spartobacteria bacterium]